MTREAERRIHRLDHRTLADIVINIFEAEHPDRPRPSCVPGCWAQDPECVVQGLGGVEWETNSPESR